VIEGHGGKSGFMTEKARVVFFELGPLAE